MSSCPGPAGWTGRGSPVPGLAVGRPSRAGTKALPRPQRPSRGRPVRAVRGYSTYRYISRHTTVTSSRPPQSGTGPTSPRPGPALVSRADSLAAARRLCSARRERPVAPIGRPYVGAVERDRTGAVQSPHALPRSKAATEPARAWARVAPVRRDRTLAGVRRHGSRRQVAPGQTVHRGAKGWRKWCKK